MKYLLDLFGAKLVLGLAVAATWVIGWATLQTAFYALYTAMSFSLPTTVGDSLPLVFGLLPGNTASCLSTLVTAKIAIWLWDKQAEWMRMLVNAS